MTEKLEGRMSIFDLDIWSGKTCQEPLAAGTQKERTSQPSSKKSSKLQSREPLCLCVYRMEDRQNPGAFTLTMAHGALLGEYTMRSFGEHPKEENVSRLSQILEACPHPKYSLSAKACLGILNRAERRGKKLPEKLETALRMQAGLSPFKNEPESPEAAKAY